MRKQPFRSHDSGLDVDSLSDHGYLTAKLESIHNDVKELKIDVISLKEDRVKFNTYFKIAAIVSWLIVGLALGTTEHMLEGLHILK